MKKDEEMIVSIMSAIGVCESKENQRNFFSRETYLREINLGFLEKNTVIDLMLLKLLGVCHVVSPSRRKGFLCK